MSQVDPKPIEADRDGNVVIALGKHQAGKQFFVDLRPAPKRLTPEQWKALFDQVAGTWEGDSPDPDAPPAQ